MESNDASDSRNSRDSGDGSNSSSSDRDSGVACRRGDDELLGLNY